MTSPSAMSRPVVGQLVNIGLSEAQTENTFQDAQSDLELANALAISIAEAGGVAAAAGCGGGTPRPQPGTAPTRRPRCEFGEKCFRKNPEHKKQFSHVGDPDWESAPQQSAEVIVAVESTKVSDREGLCRKRSWGGRKVCMLILGGLLTVGLSAGIVGIVLGSSGSIPSESPSPARLSGASQDTGAAPLAPAPALASTVTPPTSARSTSIPGQVAAAPPLRGNQTNRTGRQGGGGAGGQGRAVLPTPTNFATTVAPATPPPPPPPLTTTAAPPTATVDSTPHYLMTCPGDAVLTTTFMNCDKYDAVSMSVVGLLQGLPSQCTADFCPQADWAGCVLRMAGHDFMDFHEGTGGADACTDMSDPDNAGLAACLRNGEHGVSLAAAYQEHCTEVSLADFLVIAAEAVMTATRKNVLTTDPSASPVDFRSQFRYGRTTATSCDFASGRLPNPENGCSDVEKVFVDSLGLDWSEATALMGVHTLGRARVENSGYDGWWSDPENSRRFNNNYFVVMYAKGWTAERRVNGNPDKNQWTRSDIGATHESNPASKEMMLDTDLCLAFDEDGRDISARTDRCCAWASATGVGTTPLRSIIQNNGGEYCGSSQIPRPFPAQRNQCCGRNNNDCGNARNANGRGAGAVRRFAESDTAWIVAFHTAWKKVTENGFGSLSALHGTCAA